MQSKVTRSIRSIGLSKVNQLVRASGHFPELQRAFREWNDGEIYVCKKTGSYRYRFGDASKSPAPWSPIAEKLFTSPSAFAFAAMVLAADRRAQEITKPQNDESGESAVKSRVNVIALAAAA